MTIERKLFQSFSHVKKMDAEIPKRSGTAVFCIGKSMLCLLRVIEALLGNQVFDRDGAKFFFVLFKVLGILVMHFLGHVVAPLNTLE